MTIIKTTIGNFKIRKNGIMSVTIDKGNPNEETLRVTPL